jgi:anti-sigma B factor antagonist
MSDGMFAVKMVMGVPVLTVPDEIDASNAAALAAALVGAAEDGCQQLVVDMTRTRFCDSSGVHTLVAEHLLAVDQGRQLLLAVSAGGSVPRILAISGVDRVIPSFASVAEAVGHTAAGGPRPPEGMTTAPLSLAWWPAGQRRSVAGLGFAGTDPGVENRPLDLEPLETVLSAGGQGRGGFVPPADGHRPGD